MSATDASRAGDRPHPPEDRPELEVRVTVNDDAPDECTLAPTDATGLELMCQWITARSGSFVLLEEMR